MLGTNVHANSTLGHDRHAFGIVRNVQSGGLQGFPLLTVAAGPADGRPVVVRPPRFRHPWNEHGIGSHFATLGIGGVWIDTYVYTPVYTPPAPLAYRQAADTDIARSRGPSIKTPDRARNGIILVRGDSKSYVLFP